MVELTNLCNLRCVMCGIWSERPNIDLGLEGFSRLLDQRTVRNVPVLALTGGEPFMMEDFEDYYQIALEKSPASHVNISTNGWYTDETLDLLERGERSRTSITISYDGVRSHDAVRRVEGSQDRLVATVTAVKRRFPEVPLSLKMTITSHNYAEIYDTALQCRELGIAFRFKTLEKLLCHQGRSPSDIDGPDYDEAMVGSISAQAQRVLDLGIETNRKYIQRLIEKNDSGVGECTCTPRTLFVGVDGRVFLCRKMEPIGSVRQSELDEIWNSVGCEERVADMKACSGVDLGIGFTHA